MGTATLDDLAASAEAAEFAGRFPHARSAWITSLLLLGGLYGIYSANGRAIGAGDTLPATLLPLAILRGDGPFLDRFADVLRTPEGRLPGYATDSRGHAVSRYPIGAALLAVPLEWPQVIALDLARPGWDRDPARARRECQRMGKDASAAIAALSAVVMLHVLRGLGLGRVALPAVLIVALGSDAWAVGSQAPWQHGPAALCLAATIALLLPGDVPRRRLALAGLATAAMVACRPIDLVFAGAMALWVLTHYPRPDRLAFLAPAILAALALAGYNLWFFGTLSGGYAQIEKMHPWAHGTKGTWTAPFLEGASGTLASPSHGLLVYCPWVGLALALLPITAKRLRRGPVAAWLLWSLLPYFVLLSKYSCWWGGHCFGPRFWIDANPLFAVALGLGLDWSRSRCRPLLGAFAATAAVAVGLQAVGFLCYPSSWYGTPVVADRHHERLWDWRDNEVTRGLEEGPRPRAW